MDTSRIKKIIRRRLNLEDDDWSKIKNNPKFQKLFQNAIEASKYRLFAEISDHQQAGGIRKAPRRDRILALLVIADL